MKTLFLLGAAALIAGCANNDVENAGRPENRKGFETGTHMETEPPRRAADPHRWDGIGGWGGPGGLGGPQPER